MRIARKLMLLATMAMAAMALMAPSASATDPNIQIVDESGTPCPGVQRDAPESAHTVSGGCFIHAEGEVRYFLHIFGIESTEAICRVEFEGRIQANGEGYITAVTETPHPPEDEQCNDATVEECTEAQSNVHGNEFPWHGTGEEIDTGVVEAHFDVCLDPAEAGECFGEFVVNVTDEENTPTAGMEQQHFRATDQRLGTSALCEFTIDVETEDEGAADPHQLVHIRHL